VWITEQKRVWGGGGTDLCRWLCARREELKGDEAVLVLCVATLSPRRVEGVGRPVRATATATAISVDTTTTTRVPSTTGARVLASTATAESAVLVVARALCATHKPTCKLHGFGKHHNSHSKFVARRHK
jgi:hypothetical protein